MAKDTDGLLLTASLDIEDSYGKIKEDIKKLNAKLANDNSARMKIVGGLDLSKTQSLIQSQMATISKNLKLNIGQIDTNSLNTALSNVQNKVIGTNNGLTIKPTVDGKIIEDTDALIKAVVGKLQQLNNVDLNGFKNNLKNLGFSGKDVTSAADELVQALKLTPENKSVIIDSYQNLMDSIRNTIKSDSMVADKGFDNRLVMSIYQAISEYKNLGQTATSAMANVKNATETVVNTNTQVNNSAKYISTEYQTSFGAVSNVLQQARAEFERFGEVSVVSNKSVKAFEGVPEHFKNFTIQVKSATGEVQKFFYTFENTGDKQNPVFQYMLQNINEADAGVKKLADDIAKAKAEYTSKLAGFESTNSQIKSGLSAEIANVVNEINKLGTSEGSIQYLKVAFDGLNTSANKIKENLKATGASLNPVDNAINRYKEMDNTIQDISNKFNQLKVVPNNATEQIEGLKSKLVELRNIEVSEGRTENWSQKYRELAIAVKEAETNVKKLQLAEKSDNSSAQQQSTYYNRIFENQKLIYNLKKQLLIANSEETTELNRQLTNAQKRISYSEEQLKKKQLESDELKRQKNELDNIYSAELKIANLSTKGNMLSGIDKIIAKLQSIPNQTAFLNNSQNSGVKQLQADIQNVINKYNELRIKIQSLNGNDTNATSNLRQQMLSLATEFDRVNTSAKNLKASMSLDNSMQRQAQQAELLVEKVKKLRSEIIAYQNANTKAMKDNRTSSNGITYSAEIDAMLAKLKTASSVTNAEFKKISANFRSLKTEIKSVGLEGGTIFDKLWANLKKFSSWMSLTSLVSTFVMDIRNAVTELKEIDTILTEISKTSDLTTEALAKLGKTSFESASKYGKKASDYLTGVQEMYRAGFQNAPEMSELSILAQAAGDLTSDAANDYLIATNSAYELGGSIEKLNSVLDSQNYITNNAAVSMQDMADATSEAASVAAQYGVNIDELSSLIAVAVSKTRESGSEVGNALKALFINLQDTTSKPIREAFDSVNISMTEMVNGSEKLKTPIELIKELSVAFTSLDEGDTRRANILSDIGGKYHANTLAAILSDLDSYYKMLDYYSKGQGSATQEAQKTAESWEGMWNKMENKWTEFVNEFANSDLFKSLIESATIFIDTISDVASPLNIILTQFANLLELTTKLTDKIGLLPTILGGLTLKNVGELSLKYARSYATTDIKHRECNTFKNKVVKLLENAKAV